MEEQRIEVIAWSKAKLLAEMLVPEKVEWSQIATRTGRMLVLAGVRHRHPDWTYQEILAESNRLWMERTVLDGIDADYVERLAMELGHLEIWRQVVDCSRPEPQPRRR